MALVYGVRGPDERNTVVKAGALENAVEMLMSGDVVVVSDNEGKSWRKARVRIMPDGEIRNHENTTCDDCGVGLILPGWLCGDCAAGRR